jgi:hypothetical protein
LALLFLSFPAEISAQKTAEIDYRMRFDGPIGPAQEKGILTTLHTIDPSITLSCARGHDEAKARTHASLDRDGINAELMPYGIQIELLLMVVEGAPEERMLLDAAFSGFPHPLDTGDPVADQANYATAKASWIDAHPDLYEALITAGAAVPTNAK